MSSKTKFIHLRNHEQVTDKRGEPVFAIAPWGGVTIGYQESEKDEKNHVLFTLVKCSPKDNFCRSYARNVAESRLRNGLHAKTEYLETPSGLPEGELYKILVEKYYENQEPYWMDVREFVY